jgi:hypothetical protein
MEDEMGGADAAIFGAPQPWFVLQIDTQPSFGCTVFIESRAKRLLLLENIAVKL